MASEPNKQDEGGDRIRDPHEDDPPLAPPPVFATWGRAYLFVIAFLILLIGFFYLFTLHYR